MLDTTQRHFGKIFKHYQISLSICFDKRLQRWFLVMLHHSVKYQASKLYIYKLKELC